MSMLDNSTASSAAASERPAAPLDGIELQPGEAAEHLADASAEAAAEHLSTAEAAPEPLPEAPAEASPSAAAPNSALSAPAVDEETPAATPVLEPSGEQSAQKQRGRPFQPGQSGNPHGRPKGARNKVTRAIEALIDGQGESEGSGSLHSKCRVHCSARFASRGSSFS